ncbi:MAG: tRNA 2-thiouridine(34) synthase MnmA [Dehalococcoidia bacterium]
MTTVAVAMSGGVDSSVAAGILKDEGYNVIGITMQVLDAENTFADQALTARQVAEMLGIPFHVIDLRDVFHNRVVADFCNNYCAGRTPNPCIRCNYYVKFGALLNEVREQGADLMATGHYVRILKEDTRWVLCRGLDLAKDQSYFLYKLTQSQLGQVLMPLGELTKEKVRSIARDWRFPATEEKESQEVCFIPDGDYRAFVTAQRPGVSRPGPIENRRGDILGEHSGIINYTIGQRRGIGIAAEYPLYVVDIDVQRKAIIVGSQDEIYRSELTATEVNWTGGEPPSQPIEAEAKIRYSHPPARAKLFPLDDSNVRLAFAQPQMAITPGQAVVFYEGEKLLGGGTIE